MPRFRNKTDETLEVRNPFWRGVVEPEQVIEVPDEAVDGIHWPESTWEKVDSVVPKAAVSTKKPPASESISPSA